MHMEYVCGVTTETSYVYVSLRTCSVFAECFFSTDFGLLVSALANKLSSSSLKLNISLLPLLFGLLTAFGCMHTH